jgi:hypothetical protein
VAPAGIPAATASVSTSSATASGNSKTFLI